MSKDDALQIKQLRIYELEPDRSQPRKDFDQTSLEELAQSIAEHGIIEPIIARKSDDAYIIISGERRWRAARIAGLKSVPVILRDTSAKETAEIALIENIQREDLNPIEEAEAFSRLITEFGMSQTDISKMLGKSRPAISNCLRLLTLEPSVSEKLRNGSLSEGHARALLALSDPHQQKTAADRILESQLSVRNTEKLVRELLSGKKKSLSVKNTGTEQRKAVLNSITQRMEETIGSKVVLKDRKNGGTITISYANDDDLDRIFEFFTGIKK